MGDRTGVTRGIGASLEDIVFHKSKQFYKNDSNEFDTGKKSVKNSLIGEEEEEPPSSMTSKFCWWEPPQDAIPVEFCQNSSMHGLSFIGKPHLHLSERIFWIVAFILGVVAAYFLINDVWQRYYQNPVIVTFQAREVDIDTIPFPSVTICSMNAFQKSKVERLRKHAQRYGSAKARAAREALKYVREICRSQVSFAKEFQYAYRRGEEEMDVGWNDTIAEDAQNEMMDFLLKHTLPCESLVRLCMFGEQPVECGKIFKPLITDYGKCCTFNILPLPLLINQPEENLTPSETDSAFEQKSDQKDSLRRWSEEELDLWRAWDYDEGFVISNKSQARPFRQKRAGLPYGLSVLVDPHLNDWYCPVSDSEGFRFILHNSLEMPLVNEFASLIPLDQEIMVEIQPEITNADDDIRDFDKKIRNCYFPEEYHLQFYGPYTTGNCFAECTALMLRRKCNCTYFYMPRDYNTGICNSNADSEDYKCMENAKSDLLDSLKTHCKHCESLCESIDYKFVTTSAALQNPLQLWGDPDPEYFKTPPEWANNKMSIIHIFLGSETVVPKLRQRLYGITDLIASTGGLLGLCLGFSILSAVEVIYFLTLRTFWKFCRKRRAKRNKSQRKLQFTQNFRRPSRERIIHLNPNQIPLVHKPMHHYAWTTNSTHQLSYASPVLMNKKGI